MGRYAGSTDPEAGNGAVLLRSPSGATARVRPHLQSQRRWLRRDSEFLMGFWHWLQVSLHGGQVVSWRNDRGDELLFTSSKVSLPLLLFLTLQFSSLLFCSVLCWL